jgi:hypothetical protein
MVLRTSSFRLVLLLVLFERRANYAAKPNSDGKWTSSTPINEIIEASYPRSFQSASIFEISGSVESNSPARDLRRGFCLS